MVPPYCWSVNKSADRESQEPHKKCKVEGKPKLPEFSKIFLEGITGGIEGGITRKETREMYYN